MTLTPFMLLSCVGTLLIFVLARRVSSWTGGMAIFNPTLVAALMVGAILFATGVPVSTYVEAATPLRSILNLAIVALGAIIYTHRHILYAEAWQTMLGIVCGSLAGILSGVFLARLMGLEEILVKALSVRSVTSAFAIALMDRLGGPADLAAGLVITTGIIGGVLLPGLIIRLGLDRGLGVAMGQAAHIVGTALIARRDPTTGARAALAMAMGGVVTSLILPWLWPWLF